VINQLRRYTDWLHADEHIGYVKGAYRINCQVLVGLRELARQYRSDIEALGAGVLAVGKCGAAVPPLCDKPRLLIDARKPDTAFVSHHHLEKLRSPPYEFHVQMIEHDAPMVLDVGA